MEDQSSNMQNSNAPSSVALLLLTTFCPGHTYRLHILVCFSLESAWHVLFENLLLAIKIIIFLTCL